MPEHSREDGRGEDRNEEDSALRRSRLWSGFRGRRWLWAVGAIIVLGLGASIAAALTWRSSVRARERQTFETA
ncbi:MAG TPA: hypothetical protein VED41_09075, partial [Solirubrobacteraceae bacterium]|nr:hypothetical protein [Solirubrobacteraceae bacterium]